LHPRGLARIERAPNAVLEHTLRQAYGQLRVIVHGLPEADGIGELRAVQLAAGVDRDAVLLLPIRAGAVEVLEAQTDRRHEAVAPLARRVRAVARQSLANSTGLRVLDLAEVDVGRRIGHRLTEHELAKRLAAQRRRAAAGMRERREEAQMRQDARARAVL